MNALTGSVNNFDAVFVSTGTAATDSVKRNFTLHTRLQGSFNLLANPPQTTVMTNALRLFCYELQRLDTHHFLAIHGVCGYLFIPVIRGHVPNILAAADSVMFRKRARLFEGAASGFL